MPDIQPRITEQQIEVTIGWLKAHGVKHCLDGDRVIATDGIEVPEGHEAYLPALSEIFGHVLIRENSKLNTPALAEVSERVDGSGERPGSVVVLKDATINAPALVESDYIFINKNSTLNAPALHTVKHLAYATEFFGHKVELFDGIGTVTQSAKLLDDITVRKCRKASFRHGKLVGDQMYVVSRGEHHAHGETLNEAIADLSFKEADKDVSKYRGMSLDTEKSVEDWIFVYRVVTGSCRLGVQDFIQRLTELQGELKDSYTLADVLEMTKGEFQCERLREVVAA